MSLAALLNRPLTVLLRTDSSAVDEAGDTVYDETPVDVLGELQQIRRDEPTGEEFSDTSWNLYLPAGTQISAGDVVLDGDDAYEVVGSPWEARNPRTQTVSHIEATLRQTAAAVAEPEEEP